MHIQVISQTASSSWFKNTRLLLIATLSAFTSSAQADGSADLANFSLEALMNIEVTSASKSAQSLSQVSAALYVLTQEDIRRSGVSSIPEALRMVPGLHVTQIDANNWAISSRGFNDRFSNKLLVLMDGRTLYTPLFSGVYWNVQDTVMADIERIEVIRGSGGTLWGSNAVNGVINITTKRASDTQGTQIVTSVNTNGESVSMRYGNKFLDNGHYRIYAKGINKDNFKTATDNDAHDSADMQRGGFRIDISPSHKDDFTVQGDFYTGDNDDTVGQTSLTPASSSFIDNTVKNDGSNVLLRWTRQLDSHSEWSLQAYIDQTHREDNNLDANIDTYDIDFQHRLPIGKSHEVTWGLGYRYIEDDIKNSFTVAFTPDHREQEILSAFVQDKVQLNDKLSLTLGTKYENNDYSGDEFQPSARILWSIKKNHSLWAAISRAVRSPSRGHNDLRLNVSAFPGMFPTLVSIFSNEDFDSEDLTSIELGYRGQPSENVTLDVSTFYNKYNNLLSKESNPFRVETTPAPAHGLISTTNGNTINATSYGMEISSTWQTSPDWRIYSAYSWIDVDASADSDSTDANSARQLEDGVAHHQIQLRSQYKFSSNIEFDTNVYYTSRVKEKNIPAYTRVDLRLGWAMNKNVDVDIIAQNIFDDRHPEFTAQDISNSEIPRALGARMAIHW